MLSTNKKLAFGFLGCTFIECSTLLASTQLTGPDLTQVDVATVFNFDGHSLEVTVDWGSVYGCYTGVSPKVNLISSAEDQSVSNFLIELNSVPVPAVVCDNPRYIPVSTKVTLTPERQMTYGKLTIMRLDNTRPATLISRNLSTGAEDNPSLYPATLKSYLVELDDNRNYSISIDKTRYKGCYSGVHYSAVGLQDPGLYSAAFFVGIESSAIPAVECSPNLMKWIDTGVEFMIPRNQSSSTEFIKVYVQSSFDKEIDIRINAQR